MKLQTFSRYTLYFLVPVFVVLSYLYNKYLGSQLVPDSLTLIMAISLFVPALAGVIEPQSNLICGLFFFCVLLVLSAQLDSSVFTMPELRAATYVNSCEPQQKVAKGFSRENMAQIAALKGIMGQSDDVLESVGAAQSTDDENSKEQKNKSGKKKLSECEWPLSGEPWFHYYVRRMKSVVVGAKNGMNFDDALRGFSIANMGWIIDKLFLKKSEHILVLAGLSENRELYQQSVRDIFAGKQIGLVAHEGSCASFLQSEKHSELLSDHQNFQKKYDQICNHEKKQNCDKEARLRTSINCVDLSLSSGDGNLGRMNQIMSAIFPEFLYNPFVRTDIDVESLHSNQWIYDLIESGELSLTDFEALKYFNPMKNSELSKIPPDIVPTEIIISKMKAQFLVKLGGHYKGL